VSDRSRHDHGVSAGDLLFRVSCVYLGAELPESSRRGVVGEIGPAHLVAQREQHLGDAAHAGSAYTHKVHLLYLMSHVPASFIIHHWWTASAMHTSATALVASGLAAARAARAIVNSLSRVYPPRTSASRRAVNWGCAIMSAAPRPARNFALVLW